MAEVRKHQKGYKNLLSPEELNSRRTPEQHSKDSQKAGKASGQARRDKRTLKEIVLDILSSEAPEEDIKKYGLPEGTSNSVVMTVAAARKAKEGDLKAYEVMRDTAGQMPTKEVQLSAEIMTDADKALLEKVQKRLKEEK